MSKNRNLKKGFSLVEALIALTLIALIFATATTAIISTVNNRRYTEVKRFFINETQNYLECYKRGGKNAFCDNLQNLLDIKAEKETKTIDNSEETYNVYTVYYSRTFEVVASSSADAYFTLEVNDKDNAFSVIVYEAGDDTKTIYKTKTPYVSRFDIQEA